MRLSWIWLLTSNLVWQWDETFRFAVPTIIGQGLTCELWDYNRCVVACRN